MRKGTALRVARIGAIAVVGLYVLYLALANGALALRLVPSYLDDVEEEVRIAYASAWTWWPGRISAKWLRISTQDSKIQSEMFAERASGALSILPLFSRRLEVHGARAKNLSLRIRARRVEADALAEQATLPPMVVWGPLAILETPAPPPSNPDDLWRIVFEDAESTSAEIWVEGVRLTGDIHVRGSMDFAPLRSMVLRRVHVRVEDGRVERIGDAAPLVAEDVDVDLQAQLPAFDVAAHPLAEILRFLDLNVVATGMVVGHAEPRAMTEDLTFVDGSGPFDLRLAARQGRLLAGSTIEHRSVRLELVAAAVRLQLRDADLRARATSDEAVKASVVAPSAVLGLADVSKAVVNLEGLSAAVDAKMVPHFLAPTFDGGKIAVPAANTDLAGFDRSSPGVRVRRGIGFARLRGEVDAAGRAMGEAHTRVENLDATLFGVGIAGRSTADLELTEGRLGDDSLLRWKGFVALENVAMTAGKERVDGWWSRLELGGLMKRKGAEPWNVDATMLGRFKDARPAVAVLDGGNFVPGLVADQLEAEGLVAELALQKRGPRLQLDVKDAKGEGARVRGRMVDTGDEVRGSFLVQTTFVDVGISLVGGGTQVQVLAGEGWLEREKGFLATFSRENPDRPAGGPSR